MNGVAGRAGLILAVVVACGSGATRVFAQVAPPAWSGDTRLQKLLKVETEGMALTDLLAAVSKVTGVALSTRGDMGPNKVIVFAKRWPAGSLLASIAALFNYSWERVGDGTKPRYELFAGQKARVLEAQLALDSTGKLAAQIQKYAAALRETPAELNERQENDPVRLFMRRPENRVGIQFYNLLTPQQKRDLFARHRFSERFSSLTAPQQTAVTHVMGALIENLKTISERFRENGKPGLDIPMMEEVFRHPVKLRIKKLGGVAQLWFSVGGLAAPVANADSSAVWLVAPNGDPYESQHKPPVGKLPDRSITQAAIAAGRDLQGRLRKLAADSGVPTVADFYRTRPVTRPAAEPAGPNDSAEGALDKLCAESGYLWWVRDGTLMFRKRDWYLQRLAEPSEQFFTGASARPSADPTALTELRRFATLTQAQMAGVAGMVNPVIDDSELDGLPDLLEVLRLMPGGATPDILAEGGLDAVVGRLPTRAQAALQSFAAAKDLPNASLDSTVVLSVASLTQKEDNLPRADRAIWMELQISCSIAGQKATYYISIPRGVPDDRSDRTIITSQD